MGANHVGQLGTGTRMPLLAPTEIVGLPLVLEAAVGRGHTVAAARDGSAWSWGEGAVGQLGHRSVPANSLVLLSSDYTKVLKRCLVGQIY